MKPKPITITPEVAARYTDPDQFAKFDAAVRKILTAPHAEIVRREQEHRRQSALNPNRRGPKPKGASRVPGA
jgi:hypothetical protein